MPTLQFLVTSQGKEIPLISPPPGFTAGVGEQIIEKEISEQQLEALLDPTTKHFKAYRFMPAYTGSRDELPDTVNYRLLPLHVHQVLDRGLRIELTSYGTYDGVSYSDPVVRELHDYDWYPQRSIPRYREKRIQFLMENGAVGYEKVMPTYFTTNEASKLHQARKAANIGAMKETLLQLFMREAGPEVGYARVTSMFSDMLTDVQTYEQAQEGPLLDMVATYSETILDAAMSPFNGSPTIREYIISELDIPKYIPEA